MSNNTSTTIHCPRCGIVRPVNIAPAFADGVAKFGLLCAACAEIAGRERDGATVASGRQAREALWQKLVPLAYRLEGEPEHGLTSQRFLEANRAFPEALGWNGKRNCVIAGPSGCQKTRVAFRLLRRAFASGSSVAWHTSFNFQGMAEESGSDAKRRQFMKQILKPDVVLFDDLLKSPWTVATWSAFFEFLEHRSNQGRPVLVTCNDGPNEIVAALEATRSPIGRSLAAPIIRRLTEGAHFVLMEEPAKPEAELGLVTS